MAVPADQPVRALDRPGGQTDSLRLEVNKLITQFRALCTKLDADAGVTDTNYSALLAAADAASPARVTTVF
jgi:hypothetical protein